MVSKKIMIEWYACYAEINVAEAAEQWERFCSFIEDTLLEGHSVTIAHVGTLCTKKSKASIRYNLVMGDKTKFPSKMRPSMDFIDSFRTKVAERVPVYEE